MLEAVPRVENGVRVSLDWQQMKVGLAVPGPVREAMERPLQQDLRPDALPIPVWLDEIRCEPGRVTAIGKARSPGRRLPAPPSVRPFAPREPQPVAAPPTSQERLTPPANELTP